MAEAMKKTATLIVVNYRSAVLTKNAIASARRSSPKTLKIVVVDNSVDAAEAARLREAGADELLVAERNLGYAAGINFAMDRCEDLVIVTNPDVVFFADAIDNLLRHLEDRTVGVVGPKFCWDDQGRWLLPPADLPTRWSKQDEMLARRSGIWRALRDRRRFRRRLRFWRRDRAARVRAVSGAVMAFRRSAWGAVGGFDERFQLYFEEVDFMRRLRDARLEVVYEPAALCRHLYSQSAGSGVTVAQMFARAEVDYFRKWYGERFIDVLRRPLPPHPARIGEKMATPVISIPGSLQPSDCVVEISPLDSFDAAAGYFPSEREVRVPAEILATSPASELHVRVVERRTGFSREGWDHFRVRVAANGPVEGNSEVEHLK